MVPSTQTVNKSEAVTNIKNIKSDPGLSPKTLIRRADNAKRKINNPSIESLNNIHKINESDFGRRFMKEIVLVKIEDIKSNIFGLSTG